MNDDQLAQIEDLIQAGRFLAAAEKLATISRVISPGQNQNAFEAARDMRGQAVGIVGDLRDIEHEHDTGMTTSADFRVVRRKLTQRMLMLAYDMQALFKMDGVVPATQEHVTDIEVPKDAEPERVNGRSNLQDISWLEEGLVAARAVVRVIPPRGVDANSGVGTGFLLPGGWVMTNEHVVSTPNAVAQTRIETNFERDTNNQLKPTSYYRAISDGMISVGLPYDFSLFRVDPSSSDVPLATWGCLKLSRTAVPKPGDPLNIIQHPQGGEKKIAITSNQCIRVNALKIEYLTDTLKGSSGSPVFDETWNVVALHRAGGKEEVLPNGRTIYPNEGVSIARILEHELLQPILDDIIGEQA